MAFCLSVGAVVLVGVFIRVALAVFILVSVGGGIVVVALRCTMLLFVCLLAHLLDQSGGLLLDRGREFACGIRVSSADDEDALRRVLRAHLR
jgi:hypothetical protein